mmetsp:Transcript_1970/g.6206  ORF Transcript_1970/g.6206 Transcript_1970/m.6206 type:complete len:449 (-) Transcript_1970:45-1391(-)
MRSEARNLLSAGVQGITPYVRLFSDEQIASQPATVRLGLELVLALIVADPHTSSALASLAAKHLLTRLTAMLSHGGTVLQCALQVVSQLIEHVPEQVPWESLVPFASAPSHTTAAAAFTALGVLCRTQPRLRSALCRHQPLLQAAANLLSIPPSASKGAHYPLLRLLTHLCIGPANDPAVAESRRAVAEAKLLAPLVTVLATVNPELDAPVVLHACQLLCLLQSTPAGRDQLTQDETAGFTLRDLLLRTADPRLRSELRAALHCCGWDSDLCQVLAAEQAAAGSSASSSAAAFSYSQGLLFECKTCLFVICDQCRLACHRNHIVRLQSDSNSNSSSSSLQCNCSKSDFCRAKNIRRDTSNDEKQAEVAQGNAAAGSGSSSSSAAASNLRQTATDECCSVCWEAPKEALLYRCGHICLCVDCANDLKNANLPCPICRAPIEDVVKVFRI